MERSEKPFAGKVALITGGGRGQGRSHAVRFAELGADVIVIDNDGTPVNSIPYELATAEDIEETTRLIEQADRRAVAVRADVRSLPALEQAVERGRKELGEINIVCANAGIGSFGRSLEMSEETWLEMIDINLNGVWRTIRAAAPSMVAARRGGVIVLTASTASFRAPQNLSHYAAAKHGVIGLMKSLAAELGPEGIRVNAVCPGAVRTAMLDHDTAYHLFRPDLDDPGLADLDPVLGQMTLTGEPWVEIGDVTDAVVWLASPAARHVTGVALPVDIGHLVK